MPRILNVAVVGAGTMAQSVHLPVLRRRWDRFAVTALADISPRRRTEASETWGIPEERRYESAGALVAAIRAKEVEVDAVVLASDGLHVEDVLAFIRRGIPVLVEPPLGFSEEEVRRVADFERMAGRRLVMLAYPQAHDESVVALAEKVAARDLRMLEHEVLMPAGSAMFSHAHVTVSAYDVPSETRAERREALRSAVVAGTGDGATQRDRDFFVKGLLTGLAHELAVLERAYGPLAGISAVRQWPSGVIPGSVELLGTLEGGAPVRLVWHYLPFSPEYRETLRVLSARRQVRLELPAPSFDTRRSTIAIRQKEAGLIQEEVSEATSGAAEAMWEDFHAVVTSGARIRSGAEEALRHVALLRDVLARIVEADGRSLDPEPEIGSAAEPDPDRESESGPEQEPEIGSATESDGRQEPDRPADDPAQHTDEEPDRLATDEPDRHRGGSVAAPAPESSGESLADRPDATDDDGRRTPAQGERVLGETSVARQPNVSVPEPAAAADATDAWSEIPPSDAPPTAAGPERD